MYGLNILEVCERSEYIFRCMVLTYGLKESVIVMDKEEDSLYKEAMFMAEVYGIPKILVDDYYEAFVEFVREELDYRIKTGMVRNEIHPEIFLTVMMGEANIG